MAETRWTLCPRCGSPEIHGDHLTPLGQQHKCNNCGYQGAFVIQADTEEDAARLSQEINSAYEAEKAERSDDPDE